MAEYSQHVSDRLNNGAKYARADGCSGRARTERLHSCGPRPGCAMEHPKAFPLLRSLPNVIHIPEQQGQLAPGFSEIVDLIAREAAAPRLGTEVMLRRLTELLFIQVVRIWIQQQGVESRGWLAALHDQSIACLSLHHPDEADRHAVADPGQRAARYRSRVARSRRRRPCRPDRAGCAPRSYRRCS